MQRSLNERALLFGTRSARRQQVSCPKPVTNQLKKPPPSYQDEGASVVPLGFAIGLQLQASGLSFAVSGEPGFLMRSRLARRSRSLLKGAFRRFDALASTSRKLSIVISAGTCPRHRINLFRFRGIIAAQLYACQLAMQKLEKRPPRRGEGRRVGLTMLP